MDTFPCEMDHFTTTWPKHFLLSFPESDPDAQRFSSGAMCIRGASLLVPDGARKQQTAVMDTL